MPTHSTSGTTPKKISNSAWLSGAVLIVITVAVYLPALNAGYIWDDDEHLTRNPCIIGPLGFKDVWTSSQGYYYPLVLSSFWALHKLVGLNPLPYHLLNVLLHASSAVVLWRVLRLLGVRAAWFGAALWALHPVMVQSVAWITELKNTQSCLFFLLSILFFLKAADSETSAKEIWPRPRGKTQARPSGRQRKKETEARSDRKRADVTRRWCLGLSLLLFFMAITSKSATVMLPVVLLLCLWWRNGRVTWLDLTAVLPFFLISAAASGWTIWEQKFHSGAVGVEWSQTWSQRLAIAGMNIWFYLGKIFWPRSLTFIYPQWKIDGSQLTSFLPLAAAIGGIFLLWWKRSGPLRPVFVAAVYFTVSLFPVLGFFTVYFFRYSFVSDHFQYLAAMGPLALAASGIEAGVRSASAEASRWLQPALKAALIAILGTLTWRQATNYASADKLYRMAIERNPDCWLAYGNLGAMALQERRVDEAIGYFRKGLEIKPDAAEIQYDLGNAFLARGEFARAIAPYQAALRARPKNAKAHNNLAICLAAGGKVNEAIEEFRQAIRVDPNFAEGHYNLGYTLAQIGRRDEAAPHLMEALRLQPDYAQAREILRQLGVPVAPP
jgi:Flp pilus assembly protein TadD